MSDIDTRPQTVNIYHYAGDTLSISVVAQEGLAEDKEWLAQVKQDRNQVTPDAEFDIELTADGAALTLTAATTRSLAQTSGVLLMGRALREATPMVILPNATSVVRYQGVWDVQISGAGGADPVTTLAQGSFTIDMDVAVS